MKSQKTIGAIAAAIALALMLIPASAAGQTTATDPIYKAIRQAGVHVDNLRVVPVEGIVIVRGRVHDEASFNRVARVLNDLGYLRVANLMKITPPPNDEMIEREAERALHITRALDGSRLRVHCNQGVAMIEGKVRYELQRDAAVNIVRGIDGVREVQTSINKM